MAMVTLYTDTVLVREVDNLLQKVESGNFNGFVQDLNTMIDHLSSDIGVLQSQSDLLTIQSIEVNRNKNELIMKREAQKATLCDLQTRAASVTARRNTCKQRQAEAERNYNRAKDRRRAAEKKMEENFYSPEAVFYLFPVVGQLKYLHDVNSYNSEVESSNYQSQQASRELRNVESEIATLTNQLSELTSNIALTEAAIRKATSDAENLGDELNRINSRVLTRLNSKRMCCEMISSIEGARKGGQRLIDGCSPTMTKIQLRKIGEDLNAVKLAIASVSLL
jgi:septal ring factor EnvC (AmiA/AmiB activator)